MADDNQASPDDIYEDIKILVVDSWGHANHLSPSIQRVPRTLRDVSVNSYTPRIVSIGPYHKENESLMEVEVHKKTCLLDLFHRLNIPWKETMKACFDMVLDKIDQIKACYEHDMLKTYNDHEVAKTMVIDSCFILELVYRSNNYKFSNRSFFDNKLRTLYVKHDLLLLENQIPFFVLKDIFENTIGKFKPRASLVNLLLSFLEDMNPFKKDLLLDNINVDDFVCCDHILGLLQKCYWHKDATSSSQLPADSAAKFAEAISYSVTELSLAGVKFKPNKDSKWVLDMKFKPSRSPCFCCSWRKPTFRMPKLKIEDYTESVLRNLIAYEQSSPEIPNYITSYAFALEQILDTKDDVVKVIDSGLLVNNLGSSKQVSNMVNSICKEVTVNDFFYIKQWKDLHDYYSGYWPKNIAWLRRTYFGSPWSFISLLAALFLFGLTVVQTYYTIHSP